MHPTPLAIIATLTILPAACSPGGEPPADPYGIEGATVSIEGGAALGDALNATDSISVLVSEDGSHVTLEGEPADRRSGGRTSGAFMRLGSETEQAFSGQQIEVTLVVRGADATLDATYSTNDVGNSGWRSLSAGETFAARRFTYDVPQLDRGREDFLGLIPVGGAVDVSAIAIRVVDDEME